MPLSQIQRIVTHSNDKGEKIFELTDHDDGYIQVRWFNQSGAEILKCERLRRESLLDALMILWPENIAYQFEEKDEEEEDDS